MPNPAQQRLDAMAKKKGFPSYAAMKAWNEKYRAPITNTAKPKKEGNFLQKILRFSNPVTAGAGPAMDAMNRARARNRSNRQ